MHQLAEKGVLGGVSLGRLYPGAAELENGLVVGRPDDRWGETVHAEIVLRADASAEELIAHCRDRIAGYKCPRSIGFRDAMPLSAAGKILKAELRAALVAPGVAA